MKIYTPSNFSDFIECTFLLQYMYFCREMFINEIEFKKYHILTICKAKYLRCLSSSSDHGWTINYKHFVLMMFHIVIYSK